MKVIQLLPTISYGDAVSNDVIALYHTLKKAGFTTGIYAENIDSRLPMKLVSAVSKVPRLNENDIIIYHLSTGTKLNYEFLRYRARKIMIYHNITPPSFFEDYSIISYELCRDGRKALAYLADKAEYCLADSEYNKQELVQAGYKCPVDVLPILIPFEDYEQPCDSRITDQYQNDRYTNIIFTGRIAPNKKQEDVIRAFYAYQKYYNPESRLFIVGSYSGMECYYQRLCAYVKALGVQNVIFTGHVKFAEILAYYKLADVFLCMSEHEGFCVPLVEAMYFQIPVVAYDSSAIGYTLGGAGVLLKEKNPLETAGMINYLMTHEDVKKDVVRGQNDQLKIYDNALIERKFLELLSKFQEVKA